MSARDELRGTLSNTICNASNYPKRALPYLLGGDMSAVIDKTADAVLAAGYEKPRVVPVLGEDLAPQRGELQDLVGDAAERDDDDWYRDAANAILAAGYRKALASPVLGEVQDERARQDAKWGEQNHPNGTGPDIRFLGNLPVYGRLASQAKYRTDTAAAVDAVTFADILLEEVFEALAEEDPDKLRTELIQVAAVAAQWVEAIDRKAARS